MNIHEDTNIYLQEPVDRVEYVAHIMMKAYLSECKSWYDLAKVAIAAVEKYNAVSRKA